MSLPIRRIGMFALPAVMLVLFVWVIFTRGPMASVKVTVASATVGTLQPAVAGIGTVEARRSYAVGPTQAGRVRSLLVDQGDQVKQGQLLGAMDPVDVEERHKATRMAIERARHSAVAATAQLAEAKSRFTTAQSSANRFSDLVRNGYVSKEQADAKFNDAEAAGAGVQAASAAQLAAEQEVARLSADAAGVGEMRRNLNLYSPTDGIVISRDVEPGSTVVAGQSAYRLIDPTSLWLRARIDQARAAEVRVGQSVEVVLRSRPNDVLKGRVERIELTSDAVTEERIVNVGFDSLPQNWAVGELAEVTIHLSPIKDALYVPGAAVRSHQQKLGVWRIVEGKAEFVAVRIGAETLDGYTQVTQGLAKGDQVIVYSTQALEAGRRVRTVESLKP
jgi:HlyD family secretion protein